MKIRPRWLRDIASIVFTAYYLIAAEQADEKVRRVRATLTVEHLRVSWNKATTPYLSLANRLLRPRLMRYAPREIRIPRPRGSSYKEPVSAWLYFDGSLAELRQRTRLVLDVPGGGYVAMSPRSSDDKLLAWAGKTGVPILSLDYKKAPEFPYPYALNECFDVYRSIVASSGRCAGLSGQKKPHIIVTGESAGGNLATGMMIMILQSGRTETRQWLGEVPLPAPDGLVLMYPSLDLNIGGWMTEEQMSLIQDRGMRKTNENVLRRKSEDYSRLTPKHSTSFSSSRTHQEGSPSSSDYFSSHHGKESNESMQPATAADKPTQIKTRIATSSMISYFGDRVLTPEMMRAMIILYIGPHNRPDFKTDFLLSPVLAPDAILAAFPKTYFITGERDPLVDDTVIFAGRIRQAKLHRFRERQDLALENSQFEFNEKEHVEVNLIPGISHGFVNFPGIFPDGWRHINKCAKWILELFEQAAKREKTSFVAANGNTACTSGSNKSLPSQHNLSPSQQRYMPAADDARESRRSSFAESSTDDDHPLEMSVSKFTPIKNTPQTETQGQSSLSSVEKENNHDSHNSSSLSMLEFGSHSNNVTMKQPLPLSLPAPKRKTDSSSKPLRTRHSSSISANKPTPLSFLPLLKTVDSSNVDDDADGDDGSKSVVSSDNGRTFTRLPSEEDLIGRRMDGLAGGLMGLGEGVRTP